MVAAGFMLWTNKSEVPKEETPQAQVEDTPKPKVERAYTEAEKLQILANLASSSQKDTTTTTQDLKTLQNLSKTAPPDKTSTEEKLRILESLNSGSN